MRDETARWLEPMMVAAADKDIRTDDLLKQAIMPAAEADDARINALVSTIGELPAGTAHGAIDWIRFGQLLRERLGWHSYPDVPPGS